MPFRLEAGVNRSIVPGETIAAISTAAGEAAIALVRISGEDAIAVADKIFRGKQRAFDLQSHTQHLREIIEDGVTIDQPMLAVHRSPTSYNCQELVEISYHDDTLVTTKDLDTCMHADARPAR